MLICNLWGNDAHAATVTASDFRGESYGYYGKFGNTGTYVKIPSGIDLAPVNGGVVTTSDGPALRIIYIQSATDTYWSMASVPGCQPMGLTSYNDSTGNYSVKCNIKVKYYGGTDYEPYNRTKARKVVGFAVDSLWAKNGVIVDPTHTLLPDKFDGTMNFTVFGNNTTPIRGSVKANYIEQTAGRTVLGLNIDDIVTSTSDDVVINYSWSVSPGADSVSSIYSKMYMEQLDSNIDMVYVKPDGSGSAVIVPNHIVVIEDTGKRLASNGQIKLSLDSKTGFGTKSSRLRVTVEWQ